MLRAGRAPGVELEDHMRRSAPSQSSWPIVVALAVLVVGAVAASALGDHGLAQLLAGATAGYGAAALQGVPRRTDPEEDESEEGNGAAGSGRPAA